jgi:hypothetical protein
MYTIELCCLVKYRYVQRMPVVGTCVGCVYNTLGNRCAVGNRSWDHGLEMFQEMQYVISEHFKKVPKSAIDCSYSLKTFFQLSQPFHFCAILKMHKKHTLIVTGKKVKSYLQLPNR